MRAKEEAEAEKLLSDARLLDDAGCFSVVLEKVPAKLAAEVSKAIGVPTIGIGAGSGTDGQILVVDDMLGMTQGLQPQVLAPVCRPQHCDDRRHRAVCHRC